MLDTSLQPPDLPGFVATTTPDSVFRAALGRLPDVAVIAFDSELRVTMADGVVLERVGWRPDEWMGHRLAQVLPAARAQALDRVWSAALRGEHHQVDWQTVRGGRRLSLDIGPIRTDDGAVIGGMLVARDVTPEAGEPSSVETADLGARASLTA
jgi:PAS domain S-box-containing protein